MEKPYSITVTDHVTGLPVKLTKDMIVTFSPNEMEGTTIKLNYSDSFLYTKESYSVVNRRARLAFLEGHTDREELLAEALIKEKVSIKQLADKLGLSKKEVIDNLNSPEHLEVISKALGISSSYFWGYLVYNTSGQLVKN